MTPRTKNEILYLWWLEFRNVEDLTEEIQNNLFDRLETLKTDTQNDAYLETIKDRKNRGDKSKSFGGRLENWTTFTVNGLTYFSGDLYEDPNGRWDEGENIRTSGVIGYNEGVSSTDFIETMNTRYDLGERFEDFT